MDHKRPLSIPPPHLSGEFAARVSNSGQREVSVPGVCMQALLARKQLVNRPPSAPLYCQSEWQIRHWGWQWLVERGLSTGCQHAGPASVQTAGEKTSFQPPPTNRKGKFAAWVNGDRQGLRGGVGNSLGQRAVASLPENGGQPHGSL